MDDEKFAAFCRLIDERFAEARAEAMAARIVAGVAIAGVVSRSEDPKASAKVLCAQIRDGVAELTFSSEGAYQLNTLMVERTNELIEEIAGQIEAAVLQID